MDKFFDCFETYCRSKYDPDTYEQWSVELEAYLKDDLLKVFFANRGSDWNFSAMKLVLKKYCREAVDRISAEI